MPTDSEQFHQSALKTIIDQMQNDSCVTTMSDHSLQLSQTMPNADTSNAFEKNVNNNKKTVKKFNLNQFIQDAVYPAECPDTVATEGANNADDTNSLSATLFDASYQVNHVSGTTGLRSNAFSQQEVDLDETLMDDGHNETIVDEELIMNLSQKVIASPGAFDDSLNVDECEFLEILRRLEEQEEHDDDANAIADDSALAPLTQSASAQQRLSQKKSQNTSMLNASILRGIDEPDPFAIGGSQEQRANLSRVIVPNDEHMVDSDDDLWNEFSMAFDEPTDQR